MTKVAEEARDLLASSVADPALQEITRNIFNTAYRIGHEDGMRLASQLQSQVNDMMTSILKR